MKASGLAQPAALLEREQEVEHVRAALHALGDGTGRALVIEGAPGIGKSRLLGEAQARASALGFRVLDARATELEQGFPFGVVRQLFERPLAEADDGERQRWLAGAAALAASLLGATPTAAASAPAVSSRVDSDYAWHHGLYWLASNLAADSPIALVVDDLQWCDAPSARALAFVAHRLGDQPLGLIVATRPPDPVLAPEAAALVSDPAAELLHLSPLTDAAIGAMVAARLSGEPDVRFVRACRDVTGGNPFLVIELLDEAADRCVDPSAAAAADIGAIVPRGVANRVLVRLGRMPPEAAILARGLSALGDGAQVGDAARLAGLDGAELEEATTALAFGGIVEPGGTMRFTHPMVRTALYDDLSPAERERLHHSAAAILRERGAPVGQIAAQVMHTEPAADAGAVELLRSAAGDACALGDPGGAAALLSRALDEPPAADERPAVLLDLGQAHARAGAPAAIAPLSEIVERGEDATAIAAAATELGGMLFYAGRGAEGAAILRRAQERLPPTDPAREQVDVALLGASYTSASVRREAETMSADLRDPERSSPSLLRATTFATLAIDEAMWLRSASKAIDLAHGALASGLPLEAHTAENWAILALAALTVADALDDALQYMDEILVHAREEGAALTVATVLSLRGHAAFRRGDLIAAQADAQAALDLAHGMLGVEFGIFLAAPVAVFAGLERGETPDSLRRLIDRTGVQYDTEFLPSSQLRYASGILRAAAGNHEAAVAELRSCELDDPTFGGENPAVVPWRSAAALSLAELGRHDEARDLTADEVRRARSFGAPRAIGIALRADAIVGPRAERAKRLEQALEVLASSPARLEHARALIDLGATLRATAQRSAAREPLLAGLELAGRCGARTLERRARTELAAIGIRPRTTTRTGADSLTPSERRVVDLAATGGTNRQIAQTLFVTEKTVETHLGRAFRKLEISSRRQLPDVLAPAAG
jgi:DNA-binding CsgD family transcriptional regulator